jgi:deoxyribonuclease-4
MVKISFGPSGVGSVEGFVETIQHFHEEGLTAAEIAFVHSVYLKKEKAIDIGKKIPRDFHLSIHAPYYINLNAKEKDKLEASKKRILDCCEIGHYLGAKNIVFHAGFYSEMEKEQAYQNIKEQVLDLMEEVRKNKWNVELCPEVMGKINVFGSIEEISRLAKETGCGFCIDFAHVLARYKTNEFNLIKSSFPQKKWHCHFSGIVYGEKGEKNHRVTELSEWRDLLKFLEGLDKEITIINESPEPEKDSLKGLHLLEGSNK